MKLISNNIVKISLLPSTHLCMHGMCLSVLDKIFQLCHNHPSAWGIGILKTRPTGHARLNKMCKLYIFVSPAGYWMVWVSDSLLPWRIKQYQGWTEQSSSTIFHDVPDLFLPTRNAAASSHVLQLVDATKEGLFQVLFWLDFSVPPDTWSKDDERRIHKCLSEKTREQFAVSTSTATANFEIAQTNHRHS